MEYIDTLDQYLINMNDGHIQLLHFILFDHFTDLKSLQNFLKLIEVQVSSLELHQSVLDTVLKSNEKIRDSLRRTEDLITKVTEYLDQ